ncbi:unnamed protein product [Pleuronectes platessa]|uniref:Uncharacterized protein n=1 Tax=Pleuronectes platessa TaxID=8262 RepID=A0A9N7Z655_PLEPL|nr:unnamed protein product [Pleuronectes platessa]
MPDALLRTRRRREVQSAALPSLNPPSGRRQNRSGRRRAATSHRSRTDTCQSEQRDLLTHLSVCQGHLKGDQRTSPV